MVYQSHLALLKEIDRKREEMVSVARETGFTSEETIQCSQDLDTLIYQYQTLCRETEIQRQKGKFLFRQMILMSKKQYTLALA